ncbi:unnamed protein product [Amaranthus hypochondriacus]
MEAISNGDVSDLVDPLADYPSLYLFPRTFQSYSSSTSVQDYFKERLLSNPDKWLEQGKAILKDNSDQSKIDNIAAVFAGNERVPPKRRPALGLKHSKFSVKPMNSHPAATMDFDIDVAKLSDPVECFAAFERMENARKEVQKLQGEPLLDLDQNCPLLASRKRRPGIRGRPSTYVHHPSSFNILADVHRTSLPSQESFDNAIRSPSHNDLLKDVNVMDDSQTVRATGAKLTTTSNHSELDELLSCDYEGLDEDGVQNLLLEKLQIKPVDIGKSFLPDWRAQRPESLASTSVFSKRNDTIYHLSAGSKNVRSRDQLSPAKSKSPFASISLLNRHIAERTLSKDPYLIRHFDTSPSEATDPSREPEKRVDLGGQSAEIDAGKILCELSRSSALRAEKIAVTSENSFVSTMNDVDASTVHNEMENVVGQSDLLGDRMDPPEVERPPENEEDTITVSGKDPPVQVPKDVDQNSPALLLKDVGQTIEPGMQEDEVAADRFSARQRLMFEDDDMTTSSTRVFMAVAKAGMNEPSDTENIPVEGPSKGIKGSFKKRNAKGILKAPFETADSEEAVMKDNQVITSEQDAPVARETRSKKSKIEGTQPGQSKMETRRFSLYNAGTKWDGGVRRSTRIRMRPLQFWKGERFLYGRVNESLVTVIGVKYASPSADSKDPGIKVKSFVSDEYKDQLSFAALC